MMAGHLLTWIGSDGQLEMVTLHVCWIPIIFVDGKNGNDDTAPYPCCCTLGVIALLDCGYLLALVQHWRVASEVAWWRLEGLLHGIGLYTSRGDVLDMDNRDSVLYSVYL